MIISYIDPLANISQEYIDHLVDQKKQADHLLTIAAKERDIATGNRILAESWETQILAYWKKAHETEKQYHKIAELIHRFRHSAQAVEQNTGSVAEAAEILVCMVRQMATRMDEMKKTVHAVITRVSSASAANAFRPFLNKVDAALDVAIQANKDAIVKSLDALKAAYLLHISILGKKRMIGLKFNMEEELKKYYDKDTAKHKAKELLEIEFEGFSKKVLEYLDGPSHGLVANLDYLLHTFHDGNAFPVGESPNPLCPAPANIGYWRFPLHASPDGFYNMTRQQKEEAEGRKEEAIECEQRKQNKYELRLAKRDAYAKALQAALDAKKQTN